MFASKTRQNKKPIHGRPRPMTLVNLQVSRRNPAPCSARNGAGKSTMMKMIYGAVRHDEGEIAGRPGGQHRPPQDARHARLAWCQEIRRFRHA